MSRSILLQLAHDSIGEVFKAQRSIKREELLKEHPLLSQRVPTTLTIYFENRVRGSWSEDNLPLVDAIVKCAKKAAFEDKNFTPLKTSEYLHSEIEVSLATDDGVITQKDAPILTSSEQALERVLKL